MSDPHDKSGSEGHSGGGGHGGGGHGPGGGHGGGHEEHEGAPEWLISFADNVMLIMGFFVILLAMNMAKPKLGGLGGEDKNPSAESIDMLDFALAVRQGFNNPVSVDSNDPREAALVRRLRERLNKGDTTLPGPSGDRHNVQAVRPSDFVNIGGLILFSDGSTALSQDALTTIAEFVQANQGTQWVIEVRGHASALETVRDKEKSMRLAFDRAFVVAQELVRSGIPWERLRVAGCADNDRATPAPRTRAGHADNQRAELVITAEAAPADPYTAGATGRD